ncbi:MAG: aromatic ring-hydroxylating dioxygenase subunit alpha [Pseudomonadota bacterium]
MNSTGIFEQLRGATGEVTSTQTLPPAVYTDDTVLALEAKRIFQRAWVGIGRADRWKNPGEYAAFDLGGVPVFVIRDKSGALRGFANTCRHRGMQLLQGEGTVSTVQCPYHAWVYAQSGELMVAPTMQKTCDFDKSENGLHAFRVEEREGFAFLCMDPEAPSIDEWLGDFPDWHAPWSLGQLTTNRRSEMEVACNWKSFIEVFNEYYHLPTVHPDSITHVYDEPDPVDSVSGQFTTQFGTTQGSPAVLDDSRHLVLPIIQTLEGRNLRGTRYTWVYPNMTFAASSESIWMFEVYPISAAKTRVAMTVCFAPGAEAEKDFEMRSQKYYERFDTAIAEDVPVLEQQQIGLTSPFAKPGQFSYLEPSVANFAEWYAEQMSGEAG